MSAPYIGEIRMFGGNFAPAGWAFCSGQVMPISENDTLFNLIGTTFGGDGQETFALPNLQSRIPLHMGTSPGGITYQLAEASGVESVTLSVQQIPNHNHPALATQNSANSPSPVGTVLASPSAPSSIGGIAVYGTDTPLVALAPATVVAVGGSQPHENCQPFLCVSFIISLFGIYPQPS